MSDQTQRPTDSGDTREISLGEQPVEETKEPFAGAAEPEDTEPTQLIPDLPEDRLVPIEQEPELSVEKKKKKRKKKKKKTSPRSLLVTFLVAGAIIGISILISTIALAGFNDVFALDKPDLTVTVEIPTGSSTKEIAELLEEEGVINHSWMFRVVMKLRKDADEFQAGPHLFNSKWDYDAIIEELKTPAGTSENVVELVFPEGITLNDMARMLEASEVCSARDFLNAIENETFGLEFEEYLGNLDVTGRYFKMEGYAFPNTHEFYKGESATSVAKRILTSFDDALRAAGVYTQLSASGMTLDQVVTLASMVQAEAGTTEDMNLIASVFLNRLHSDGAYPRLESDPTRKYAKEVAGWLAADNLPQGTADLYNTYVSEGLPPGPICNPGIEAIEAVLNPASTNYYYFCSDLDTKECFYATTLDEHNQNLKKAGLA